MLRNDRFIAVVLCFTAIMAFVGLAADMARSGYLVSPIWYAMALPLVVRSIWRDRA